MYTFRFCSRNVKFDPSIRKEYKKKELKILHSKGDGYCILHSTIRCMEELKGKETVTFVPNIRQLLDMVELEVLNNLAYYGSFINFAEVDFVEELSKYRHLKSYSNDTNDIVLFALANSLQCRIFVFTYNENNDSFINEHNGHCIYPA